MSLAVAERKKYEQIWANPDYARYSPGVWALPIFRQQFRKRGHLLDIGCGTGQATAKLAELGWHAVGMDFVDARTEKIPFIKQNLFTRWKGVGVYDYGYCCDVMEHIPPEKVDVVLANIVKHCRRVFFTIHFGPDGFGDGHLHLTVQPFTWWRDKLEGHGELTDARDLMGMGAFSLVAR